MKGWEDEVILPVDKGNATFVMERSDYDGKVRELLSDTSTYRQPSIGNKARALHTTAILLASSVD